MPQYKDQIFEKCPIVYAMDLIGSKWKIPILWNLTQEDELHSNEMRRRIHGVTNTMLTRSLKELEADGLVIRESAGTVPPSVTYRLTDLGKQLIPSLDGLYKWGENHQKAFLASVKAA